MNNKNKNICIATPLVPPELGGPSLYAEMLSVGFVSLGYTVSSVSYGFLKKLPTGLRHISYGIKIIPSLLRADYIIALDTFSVAVPTIFFARLFGKKVVVRIGGDFLWEQYVERTKETVLLSEFYEKKRNFSFKERCIFRLTRYFLHKATGLVFSTEWQKNIWSSAYNLVGLNITVIENVYQKQKQRTIIPKNKVFLSPSRHIFLKNKTALMQVFSRLKDRFPDILLDTKVVPHDLFLEKLSQAYCLIVPSLSEVSPNVVLDSISLGVPVIVTADCGLTDRLGDAVMWINPKDQTSMYDGIVSMMEPSVYHRYVSSIFSFSYIHSSQDIISEFISFFKTT